MRFPSICRAILPLIFVAVTMGPLGAETRTTITVRGHALSLLRYDPPPPVSTAAPVRVLLASGDGGLRGFGNNIAGKLASWGFVVYRFDTRQYLAAFTGEKHLTTDDVMSDFSDIVDQIRTQPDEKVLLAGWSAGAALVTTAAASEAVQRKSRGVIAIALPREGVLGWSWHDHFQFLPGVNASGPLFSTLPFVPRVFPLPMAIIQSKGDKWVSEDDVSAVFAAAQRSQRTVLIDAGGHSFSADRDGFLRELREALDSVLAQQ